LNQLKTIFENEKNRLEEKLLQLKTNNDANITNLTIEYDIKLKEQEKELKNDLETIQNAYDEIKAKCNTISFDAEHKLSLLNQQIITNEKVIADHKENLIILAKEHNQAIQEKINQFNQERKELNNKIEQLQNENNIKTQEVIQATAALQKLEDILQDKENELVMQKEKFEKAMHALLVKHDQYKQKQQEITNEFLIKKMDFERETNLLKQQIDFLHNKIEEMNNIMIGSEQVCE
jgi:chromosome segregation ATPase